MSNLSKTTRQKKWTLDFVADKLAILLVLRQQVVDERESRKKSGVVSYHAQPRTKLRRLFSTLHAKYLECELLYAEDQRQDINRQEQTPSLNYQARGTRLQDGVLWDAEKRDLLECPVCGLGCTMRVDDVHTINAYNQGARDSATAKGGDGTFTAKSPKHGCYGYFLSCNGRTDGGNCPDCIRHVRNKERPARMCGPGECPFSCLICLSRCQVVFDEVHRHAITNAIDLSSKKKKRAGGKKDKEPDEKGLAVLSRVLAGSLENNLIRENQMLNGRSEDDLMQDAKTNTALELLQNPTYAIDLSLRRKLSKEVSLTRDVRLRDDGVYGRGATAAVAGGVDGTAAAGGGVAKVVVHSIQQARRILKDRAKGGAQKAGDMTPSDSAFSKSAGSHHRFSRNKLSESPIDVNQVSRDAFAAAGYATAGTAVSSNESMILRTRKRATEKMVDLAATPRTKKKAMVVRTALSGRNAAYVSVIDDMAGPGVFSQDLLAYCMEQAAQEMD
jgi:hypothetical protein